MNKDIVDCGTIEALEKQLNEMEIQVSDLKQEVKDKELEISKLKFDIDKWKDIAEDRNELLIKALGGGDERIF